MAQEQGYLRMTEPRITVITPCRNQAPYIEQTICSVIDQGYDNLEYIVIDGGSTDGTSQIIDCYTDDLVACVSEPDDGAADRINKALTLATGNLVAVLSGGDLYLPGALHGVAKAWSHCEQPQWLIGHAVRLGTDDQVLGRIPASVPDSLSRFLMRDCGQWPMAASFWNRKLVDFSGGFHRDFQFSFDYEYWCRLLAVGVAPQIVPGEFLTASRQREPRSNAVSTLQRGIETIVAAERYAKYLSLRQRCELWRNCEMRRRIYALAEAELNEQHATLHLLKHTLRHPWWLADDAFRRMLLHGVTHPVPVEMTRSAA